MRHAPRLLASLILLAAGCAGSGSTGSLTAAIDACDEGRWTLALAEAEPIADSATHPDRAAASYVAGLAAHRLGDADDAERYLERAIATGDEEIRPRAEAELGLLRIDQGRDAEAARLLASATESLDGADRRAAARHAAEAARRAGDEANAARYAAMAGASAGYTLQIGAYGTRARADHVARTLERETDRAGLGTPRVTVRDEGRGTRLYLVQVGRFDSRDEAAAERNRFGRADWFVAEIR